MSKKNVLSMIAERKSREFQSRYTGRVELISLHRDFLSLKSPEPYQNSLHVVAIASCIEAFSRSCLKVLIDEEHAPYSERVKKFKELNFDFELTKALSKKEISFGDLVSQSVSISSAEQIIKHFDIIFEGDDGYKNFKTSLALVKEFIEPSEDEIMGGDQNYKIEYGERLVGNADNLICHLQEIFSARHIAAHEANFNLVSTDQLKTWFESAIIFTNATYEIIEQTLRPGASREAFGSSIQALMSTGRLRRTAEELRQDIAKRWIVEWDLDESATEEMWKAIKESDDAFDLYLDKEESLHLQVLGLITGNGRRHVEARINRLMLESKINYLTKTLQDI